MTWQDFVVKYGARARAHHLAAVVGQPIAAITALRDRGVCVRTERRGFGELFPLFHGRPPRDEEWPAPRTIGGGYEWLAPELTLLASLIGSVGTPDICRTLTERLRRVTGDPTATRDRHTINAKRGQIGLQVADVVGGITANQAGRSIGCISIVYNDIARGRLKARRLGKSLVIPHDEWARWKGAHVFPPAGFVSLASLKRPLGIRSDKLSEWARAGYVPSAIRCNPYGTRAASTQFGTWYLDPKVKKKLIADRRAGRPMPWHNQPEKYNLRATHRLWIKRQHPAACANCRAIWGPDGAPATFEDYSTRYPPLAFGAKRHLTRVWTPGLTIPEVARFVSLTAPTVATAIREGALRTTTYNGKRYISQTDATRWKDQNCPTGKSPHSWISIAWATKVYGFSARELRAHIRTGRLRSRVGDFGAQRGIRYVLKQQVRELREGAGYPIEDVAKRFGITVTRARILARRLDWRATDRLTVDVVNSIRKRLESESGATISEVARILGKSVNWVEQQIANGVARVLRTPFKTHRRYISEPMFKRLCEAALKPEKRQYWSSEWLLVSDAALIAGTCIATVQKWADAGDVVFRMKNRFRRYHRRSVMKRARIYWVWASNHFKRATPPAWLQAERSMDAKDAA